MRTMLQQLKAYVLIFLLILVLFSGSMGKATDHIDGAFTVENPRVDLTDLYAFVKNDSPKTLVVVLNVITAAQVWERPDENIAFEVLISPAKFDEVEKDGGSLPHPFDAPKTGLAHRRERNSDLGAAAAGQIWAVARPMAVGLTESA